MKAIEIQSRLKSKDMSYSLLAEAIGVSPAHVRNVAEKIAVSQRVAEAIAKAIDEPFVNVFPEYADKTPRAKSQKRKAAIRSLRKKIARTT